MSERREPFFFGGPIWKSHKRSWSEATETNRQIRERQREWENSPEGKATKAYQRRQSLAEWFWFLVGASIAIALFAVWGMLEMSDSQIIVLVVLAVSFAIGFLIGNVKGFNRGVRWGKARMRHLDQYAERPQEWYSE